VQGNPCSAAGQRNPKHGQALKIESCALDLEKEGIADLVFALETLAESGCFETGSDGEIAETNINLIDGPNTIDLVDTCDEDVLNQEFRVVKVKKSRYQIRRANMCLEVLGTSTTPEDTFSIDIPREPFQMNGGEFARVFLNTCDEDNKYQQWEFFGYEGVYDGQSGYKKGKSDSDSEADTESGSDEYLDEERFFQIRNVASSLCLDTSTETTPEIADNADFVANSYPFDGQLMQAKCGKVLDKTHPDVSQVFQLNFGTTVVEVAP